MRRSRGKRGLFFFYRSSGTARQRYYMDVTRENWYSHIGKFDERQNVLQACRVLPAVAVPQNGIQMSIYKLYAQNSNAAGFWVQHRTWRNVCARIQSIAGQRTGPLPGSHPLYDNAEVIIQRFDVRSGRPIEVSSTMELPHDRNYTRIAEPAWSHRALDAKTVQRA